MNIILLTIGYPYPNRDVFVENEIKLLSDAFEQIFIIPVVMQNHIKKYQNLDMDLPSNVKVVNLNKSKLKYIPINKNILRNIYEEKSFNLRKTKKVIRLASMAQASIHTINKIYEDYSLKGEDTILYSFWGHHTALAITTTTRNSLLKITRAHGFDLYAERGFQPFKKFIYNNIDYVLPCSKMGEKYLLETYGLKNVKVMYLGSKNTLKCNQPVKWHKQFHVVSCSRVTKIKRIDRIIEALSTIDEHFIKWTHIGEGEQFEEITLYAKKLLKNKTNIEFNFTGMIPNSEVIKFYNKTNPNLFINVSSSEGLPVSIMEAASCYIPILATDVGGTSEIVSSINGKILKSNFSNKELVEALKEFIEMDEYNYHRMCNASRTIWENSFNSINNTNKFIEFIKQAVKEKKNVDS